MCLRTASGANLRLAVEVNVPMDSLSVSDVAMTAPVHEALRAIGFSLIRLQSCKLWSRRRCPVARGPLGRCDYVDADLLIDARAKHGIELVGPVRLDTSWQAKAGEGRWCTSMV